jgi:hypothetical protein
MQVFTTNEVVATTITGARVSLGVRQLEDGWIVFSGETVLSQFADGDSASEYAQGIVSAFEDSTNAIVPAVIESPEEEA